MDYAELNLRLGEDGANRFGESLEPIDRGNEDILDAPVVQIGQDLQPEVGSFTLAQIKPQDLFFPVKPDSEDRVERFGKISSLFLDFVMEVCRGPMS